MTFRDNLARLPRETLVPVGWVLENMGSDDDKPTWVGIDVAAEILDKPGSTLRTSARRWLRMQEGGKVPPVRVRKRGDTDRSPWLFHMGDCYALRGGPRLVVRPADAEGAPEASPARLIALQALGDAS